MNSASQNFTKPDTAPFPSEAEEISAPAGAGQAEHSARSERIAEGNQHRHEGGADDSV